jgi:putative FmdB family regulatory protein
MPYYGYKCVLCHSEQEIYKPIAECRVPPEKCNECGGTQFHKVFGMPAIHYKSPGFVNYDKQKGICKKKKPVRGPLHGMPRMDLKPKSNNP